MDGQVIGMSHSDSQPLLWMIVGRSVLEKSDKMTWCFEWTPRLENFLKKSDLAFSSWNRTWEGVGSEEVDALKRREFRDEVDFCLGAMTQLTERRKEGERKKSKKAPTQSIYQNIKNWRYVCMKMHEYVICNSKDIMDSAQSNPISTQHCNK